MKNFLTKLKALMITMATPLIPVSFKRLVLVSTLYQKAAEQQIFSHVDLEKLNVGMKIASNKEVIESAMSIKDLVWKDVDLHKLIQQANINCVVGDRVDVAGAGQITEQIITMIPAWLRYDKTEMSKDITLLFCGQTVKI